MLISGSSKTQTLALDARMEELAIGSARRLRRRRSKRSDESASVEGRSPHSGVEDIRVQQEKEAIGVFEGRR
jgi:hypothetical protein